MNLMISIFAIGILIALHELGHFVAARRVGMRVLRYSVGLMHSILSWTSKKTGIIYQVGVLPLGGFVQIKGMNPFEEGAFSDDDSYQTKSPWRRGVVLLAGPLANLLVAWGLLFALYMGGNPEPVDKPRVGDVVPGMPASKAGLKTGDDVASLNGKPLKNWTDLQQGLNGSPGKEVTLEIVRGGQKSVVKVTPEDRNGTGLIGIRPFTEIVRLPVHIAALAAGVKCGQIVVDTLGALGKAITGSGGDVQAVGPVGIAKMAASALDSGLREFLALVSYLSVMLFMFNMLPLPALDGGRGAFLLYEVISRKRVSPKADAIINSIGFFLLVGLLVVMTVKELFFG